MGLEVHLVGRHPWREMSNLSLFPNLFFIWFDILCLILVFILDPEKGKKEDLIYSFLRSITEVQAHLAHVHALAHQVRKIFFMGSFINIPLVRRFFTENIHGRNLLRPKASIFSHWVLVHIWWRKDSPQTLAHPREVLGMAPSPFVNIFHLHAVFDKNFVK